MRILKIIAGILFLTLNVDLYANQFMKLEIINELPVPIIITAGSVDKPLFCDIKTEKCFFTFRKLPKQIAANSKELIELEGLSHWPTGYFKFYSNVSDFEQPILSFIIEDPDDAYQAKKYTIGYIDHMQQLHNYSKQDVEDLLVTYPRDLKNLKTYIIFNKTSDNKRVKINYDLDTSVPGFIYNEQNQKYYITPYDATTGFLDTTTSSRITFTAGESFIERDNIKYCQQGNSAPAHYTIEGLVDYDGISGANIVHMPDKTLLRLCAGDRVDLKTKADFGNNLPIKVNIGNFYSTALATSVNLETRCWFDDSKLLSGEINGQCADSYDNAKSYSLAVDGTENWLEDLLTLATFEPLCSKSQVVYSIVNNSTNPICIYYSKAGADADFYDIEKKCNWFKK